MNNPLRKIINLAKRTGDRLIVTDPEGEEAVVVMNLDEYDKLLENKEEVKRLSENGLLDKINKDIAAWKSAHEDEEIEQEEGGGDFLQDFAKQNDFISEPESAYNKYEEKDDIEEDERFYFEPVE